jgi:hypothetical protein
MPTQDEVFRNSQAPSLTQGAPQLEAKPYPSTNQGGGEPQRPSLGRDKTTESISEKASTNAQKRKLAEERFAALTERLSPRQKEQLTWCESFSYGYLYARAVLGETSPKDAIKAKCQNCVGYQDVKPSIRGDECDSCPLVFFRPYQR